MKLILAFILTFILPFLAEPMSKEELDLETMKWADMFYEEAFALLNLMEKENGQTKEPSGSPTILNRILKINPPGPLAVFHPIFIKDEMKATKDVWDKFEWRDRTPSTPKPYLKPPRPREFTPLQFRIIG